MLYYKHCMFMFYNTRYFRTVGYFYTPMRNCWFHYHI